MLLHLLSRGTEEGNVPPQVAAHLRDALGVGERLERGLDPLRASHLLVDAAREPALCTHT